MAGSVLVGLTYMPAAPMGTKIHFDDFDKSSFLNHMFISLSGGISTLKVPGIKNTIKGLGPQFSAGIGNGSVLLPVCVCPGRLDFQTPLRAVQAATLNMSICMRTIC